MLPLGGRRRRAFGLRAAARWPVGDVFADTMVIHDPDGILALRRRRASSAVGRRRVIMVR